MTNKPAETMLSRMMEAMNDRAGYTEYGPIIPASLLEPIAKAALEAIRDGSPNVALDAMFDRLDDGELGEDFNVGDVWRAGIDAILNEEA